MARVVTQPLSEPDKRLSHILCAAAHKTRNVALPVMWRWKRLFRGVSLVDRYMAGQCGSVESSLPFHFSDYLELVDWTGRAIREDKRGYIPADVPPILTRLGVEVDSWIETVRHFRRHFYDYVGPADVLAQCSQALGRNWLRGVGACRKLLGDGKVWSTGRGLAYSSDLRSDHSAGLVSWRKNGYLLHHGSNTNAA